MKKKNLKLDKKILFALTLFLTFGLSLNVNAAYRCGTLNQNSGKKITSYVTNFGKDTDYYEYLTGAGELNDKPVVCVSPVKTYSKYAASCEDNNVNLYECSQGKNSGWCGYAKVFQIYATGSSYFNTMYRARFYKMTVNDPGMSIWEMRTWSNRAPVYKNTFNNTGKYRFANTSVAYKIAQEYKGKINGNWKNYGKSVWYSKAEKWKVNGGKFNKIAKGGYATVTIDTKGALSFSNGLSLLAKKNPIVLGGAFMNYFNVKDIKGFNDKISFKLEIKDDKYVDAISNEIGNSKNKNISNKLKVAVNFVDKRAIKAVVDVRPTNLQNKSQLYKTYKVKANNTSCGKDSEAKNDCPGITTTGNPQTCKVKKDNCDKTKNMNSKACKIYKSDCCNDLIKACDKDSKAGNAQSNNCKAVETYACTPTTDNCNDLDAAKAGKVVKNPKTGNNTFNHDVWNWLEKNGTEQQKTEYKTYCPCNCDSSAADISSGACNLNGGEKYSEEKYNAITDETIKQNYVQVCSPCEALKKQQEVNCPNPNDNGDIACNNDPNASISVNYSDSLLAACAKTGGKDYAQKIFGENGKSAVCYETYNIRYNQAKISSGVNTTLGLARYLKFEENQKKEYDNRIIVEAKKTCYVADLADEYKTKISEAKQEDANGKIIGGVYSASPDFGFTYAENIKNEGFEADGTTRFEVNSIEPSQSDKTVQVINTTATYTYKPTTKFYVGILNGQFYYHSKYNRDLSDDLLSKYDDQTEKNKNNIKPIGSAGKDEDDKGKTFPIKFTTPAQKIDISTDKVIDPTKDPNYGYKYTINVSKYNINKRSVNYSYLDDKDEGKCPSSYSCKYVITKKTCKKTVPVCGYICTDKYTGAKTEEEMSKSIYCSEVCHCPTTDTTTTTTKDEPIPFNYTTISTDKFLDSKTATAIGENWQDEKAQDTIKEIEETSKTGNTFKVPILEVEINSSNRENIIKAVENSKYVISKNENCQNKIKSSDITYCVSEFLRNYLTDEQIKKLDNSYDIYTYSSGKTTAWK